MKFGCSECVCIAIESHGPALLKSLLQRSDIVYRDMFWAPCPSFGNWDYRTGNGWVMSVPRLHHFDSHSDLSFVGREDCGHMRFDVELQTPFNVLCKPNYYYSIAYILVSLPLMARWHSSDSFNAEHIFRQSGQFDYSEPQFYHKRYGQPIPIIPVSCPKLAGPLGYSNTSGLRCEFESKSEALTVSIDSGTPPLMLYQPTSLPCGKIFVVCEFISSENESGLYKFYGKLARVVYEMLTREYFDGGNQIQRQFRAVLESGANLNLMLPYRYGLWYYWNRERKRVKLVCYDLFFDVLDRAHYADYIPHYMLHRWINLHKLLKFLINSGLSFFYYTIYLRRGLSGFNHPENSESLLRLLAWSESLLPLLPLVRAIALQLFALGYGRRELHTGSFPARDANLFATRSLLVFMQEEKYMEVRRKLQSLVDNFDAGLLTLQQLARIAVRRAVGGVDFARQVRRIKSHIPQLLFEYVAEPSEYLLTDKKVDLLEASSHL